MTAEFKGVINLDVRDSKPDWDPFLPPRAPEGAPNVLYIVWDDAGIAAFDCFGSPVIETPTMDRIADMGVRFTQWHDGTLLTDAFVVADGAQLPPQRHGVHRRGSERVPRDERGDPARERNGRRDPPR